MQTQRNESDYALALARALKRAAEHRHVVPADPWRQDVGKVAFDVELCDTWDLPSGFRARVVVTVTAS